MLRHGLDGPVRPLVLILATKGCQGEGVTWHSLKVIGEQIDWCIYVQIVDEIVLIDRIVSSEGI